MSCSAYLWGGLIKNKGGVGLFQISQKERLFHLLWQPSVFGNTLTMWFPFLHPSKKDTLQFGQEGNISGNSVERRVYWFVLKITRVFLVPTGRVGIGWWTIVEDKSMLVLFKKALPFTSLGHPFERRAYCLLLCFESCQGILYSHTGRVDRGWWTLC